MSTINTDEKQHNLDRKTASKLLKVSIRTLDRYVKVKKLSSQIVGGRIWLDREEIADFKGRHERPLEVDKIKLSTSDMSIDNGVDKVDSVEVLNQESVNTVSTRDRKNTQEGGVYKKLYLETKEELREKQERLEIANYRVGQLETQVKNSIPMLEYHRENYDKKKREEDLKSKLKESTSFIKKISFQLHLERFNKRIFLVILLITLALQPLWLLLIYE